jgi:diadenosine tetraphosphate (Ap4A) HIT family hydrolase
LSPNGLLWPPVSVGPVGTDWKQDRLSSAHRGENPLVIARMRSGFAVMGDTQQLPGYSLLLALDRSTNHLSDLELARRTEFLVDLALLGEAVEAVCASDQLRRINYEILGNSIPYLHGHVHPRYEWESQEFIGGPVWRYPKDVRNAAEHAFDSAKHGALQVELAAQLGELMSSAYRT